MQLQLDAWDARAQVWRRCRCRDCSCIFLCSIWFCWYWHHALHVMPDGLVFELIKQLRYSAWGIFIR